MSQLSDTINRHVQEALNKDGFEPRRIAPKVWEELDEESRATVGIAEIIRRMKQTAKTLTADAFAVTKSDQIELPFRLDGAVSMDLERRTIRLTESLTQLEFNRAIEIRKQQIAYDQAQLEEWISAGKLARPYWKKHPDWRFGDCVQAIAADLREKRGAA